MAHWTRRQVIATTVGVASAAAAACVWNLHQYLPARDASAEERFRRAQDLLLAGNGNRVHPRFVEIAKPRVRVQVLEGGQGDPVLLLHGGAGVAAQWEPLLTRLSSGFHIYAPDRPGCGLTDMFNYRDVPLREHAVDFVLATMDALGLESASLVGNSMGGYFALVFALAHPERVKRLITVGEPAGSSATIPPGNRLLAMRGLNGLMYATVMKPGASATYEGFKRILVAHPDRIPPGYLDCCTAASEIPGATESWLTLLEDCHITSGRSTLTYSLRPELHKLSMPTLLIWGDKDSFGPPSLAQEMAQMIPGGRAETVPDAGHLAWLDHPETIAGLLTDFLRNDARALGSLSRSRRASKPDVRSEARSRETSVSSGTRLDECSSAKSLVDRGSTIMPSAPRILPSLLATSSQLSAETLPLLLPPRLLPPTPYPLTPVFLSSPQTT